MDEIIEILSEKHKLEYVDFVEKRDQGFFFFGVDRDTGEENTILVTNTNKVFIDGVEKEGISEVNIWSLV